MFREQCYTLQYFKIEPSVSLIVEIDHISHLGRCSELTASETVTYCAMSRCINQTISSQMC